MPLPELFEHIDYDNDPLQVVKKALNEFNDAHFPQFVASLIIDKEGGGGEHGGCRFAKALDESELYGDYDGVAFEGVECWSYDDEEIIVSETDFYRCLELACDRYVQIHPEKRDELEKIITLSDTRSLETTEPPKLLDRLESLSYQNYKLNPISRLNYILIKLILNLIKLILNFERIFERIFF